MFFKTRIYTIMFLLSQKRELIVYEDNKRKQNNKLKNNYFMTFRITRTGNAFDTPNSLFWNVRRAEPSGSRIASPHKWMKYWQSLEWLPGNDKKYLKKLGRKKSFEMVLEWFSNINM